MFYGFCGRHKVEAKTSQVILITACFSAFLTGDIKCLAVEVRANIFREIRRAESKALSKQQQKSQFDCMNILHWFFLNVVGTISHIYANFNLFELHCHTCGVCAFAQRYNEKTFMPSFTQTTLQL